MFLKMTNLNENVYKKECKAPRIENKIANIITSCTIPIKNMVMLTMSNDGMINFFNVLIENSIDFEMNSV